MKALSFAKAKASPLYLTVSEGNKKLKPTKDVKYIIWNLPALATCPYSTEECRKHCYALKAERAYPSCKKSREQHLVDSLGMNFVRRMIFTIEANINRKSYKTAKTIVVRIHESGDFYSQAYAVFWIEVAKHFEADKRIVFMAYTKSIDFFRGLDIPNNMVIRFSLWSDTKDTEKQKAEEMGLPIYTAVDRFADEPKTNRCLCDNCSTCRKCWSGIDKLMCEIH